MYMLDNSIKMILVVILAMMLRDVFKDTIQKSLTPANIKILNMNIAKYVDKNSDILLSFDLSTRISFTDYDREVVFTSSGVTEESVAFAIKNDSHYNKLSKVLNTPFYNISLLTAHNLLKLKKDKEANLVIVYMSLMMYTSIHKGLFKYNPNKQIMDYTIAHLDTSFILRKSSSLYAFLENNATTAFNTYKSRILRADDSDITWVIDAMWTRIKGKMKKIASEFYKNHEAGNYLNADSESLNQDDYHELDNNSFIIDRITNKTYIKLINHQFDDRFIKYSITQSDTSYTKVKNIINDIISDDTDNDVRKFISSLIEYFMYQSKKTPDYISRGDFIIFMKSAYSSNSDKEQMVFIKNILEKWVKDNMYKYGKATYGKTAMQQYKRAVYMFFVFMVNYEAKL